MVRFFKLHLLISKSVKIIIQPEKVEYSNIPNTKQLAPYYKSHKIVAIKYFLNAKTLSFTFSCLFILAVW